MNEKQTLSEFYSEYKRECGFHTIEHNLAKVTPGGPWRITGYKRFNKKVYKVHHYFKGEWIIKLQAVKHINDIKREIKEKYPEYYL